jgi:hypothetical protein
MTAPQVRAPLETLGAKAKIDIAATEALNRQCREKGRHGTLRLHCNQSSGSSKCQLGLIT